MVVRLPFGKTWALQPCSQSEILTSTLFVIIQANLYERIIDDVIQESRQDFEDSGIDEQTLLDLRNIWKEKLSKTNVAKFSWDKKREEEEAKEKALEAQEQALETSTSIGAPSVGMNGTSDTNEYAIKAEEAKTAPQTQNIGVNTTSKPDENGTANLETHNIILPGGGAAGLGQTDGSLPTEIEITIDDVPPNLRRKLAEQKKKARKHKKRSLLGTASQADGANDEQSDDSADDSDLGSDLGIDSDEINSDLDDPESDDINSDEDNDNPEANIMLCLYDRVQRVRNRWKCNLKDGIANIDGQDYAFQKATGDSEW